MDWLGLKGRTCAITGAAGGIGSRLALDLAQAGASVALLDLNKDACAALEADILRLGARALAVSVDVSDPQDVARAAEACQRALGPCRVLVNTAAISGRPDPILTVDPDKWARQVGINLNGYLYCAQQFGRQMQKAGGGSMVHISSFAGRHPQANSGAYSVTKAGVAMMSRVIALEMGRQQIRSNVVSPAMLRTPLSAKFYDDPDLLRRRQEFVPMGDIGTVQNISDAVLFLASDRASYVTGQDLLVDGGVEQLIMRLFPLPEGA